MPNTPLLGLPLVAASQSQKHVTVNQGLTRLDALVQLAAIDQHLTAPPGSPADGDVYIVAGSPTGAWSGWTNRLALYSDGAWSSIVPREGWTCFVKDEDVLLYFSGSSWINLTAITNLSAQVLAPNGALTGIAVNEEVCTLTASGQATVGAGRFPARSIMLGASVRVTTAITGTCTSFGIGIAGETSKFGGTLSKALGTTNVGVIGPTAVYAVTPIVITGVGGTITGGAVRVAIHYLTCNVSTS